MNKHALAVLISGNGSNLQALIDAAAASDYPAKIVAVISNKDDVYGLTRARQANIPVRVIRHKEYDNREAFDAALHAALLEVNAEYVCLAGFMRVLTPGFVSKWQGKMINIHPSLLPSFKGMHTHAAALAAGIKIHGCTVHYVVPEMDSGPIIAQAAVPVLAGDTAEILAARVLKAEHILYPAAVANVIGGRKGHTAKADWVLMNF